MLLLLVVLAPISEAAQVPCVGCATEGLLVTEGQGGFMGPLEDKVHFGSAVASADLNGDGLLDLVVGASKDADGFPNSGAVWLLGLDAKGEVAASTKISNSTLGGVFPQGARLGSGVAVIGDIDGNGMQDIAASTPSLFLSPTELGAVWIFLLNGDGSVKSYVTITEGMGSLHNPPIASWFGRSLSGAGDLNEDGVPDLLVGLGVEGGAVLVFFLAADGTVIAQHEINLAPEPTHLFGSAVACLGDVNDDGWTEIAVVDDSDNDGVIPPGSLGSLWILSLENDGSVAKTCKISNTLGGFDPPLGNLLGPRSVAAAGDVDGDGITDLFVGSPGIVNEAGIQTGGVWLLLLKEDLSVKSQVLIGAEDAWLGLDQDGFGGAVAGLDDINGDGVADLAVGLKLSDEAGLNAGAVWLLNLHGPSWLDVGGGVGGSGGIPALDGQGTMVPGEAAKLTLAGAPSNSLAVFIFGNAILGAPFKGGTLVPIPEFVSPALPIDAAGELELSGPWPLGAPPGYTLVFQAWVTDSTAPAGLAASNGVVATTP